MGGQPSQLPGGSWEGWEGKEAYLNDDADAVVMLFDQDDAGAFAAAKPLAAEPDEVWSYSSGTTNIVSRIVRETVREAGEDPLSFPRRALFDPLRMASAVTEPDASGSFVGSSVCHRGGGRRPFSVGAAVETVLRAVFTSAIATARPRM